MKAWKVGASLAAGLGIAATAGLLRAPASAQEEPVWLGDYAAAQAAARQTGKPVFLVFR